MRIAILGGGFTGLTASYYLSKKGHEVTLFEKEKVLGGLAVGFKGEGWEWYLERAYHHLLSSEDDILSFADEIGFDGIFFKSPETASLYETHPQGVQTRNKDFYRIFPVDTPQDFLRFPLLSYPEKIRAGLVIAFLKLSPFFTLYEKQTAKEFLQKTMGNKVWEILWQELFRKKFGKYAENILASFIWARIKKRAKKLGYIEGGFQTFIDYVEKKIMNKGVTVKKGYMVNGIKKRGEGFDVSHMSGRDVINHVSTEYFDKIISTLPTVIMKKITGEIFSTQYLNKFSKLKYLHAVVLILETKQPILEKTYWLNICTPKLPLMIVAQHTNFIDKKHYGGKHLAYVGWYVDRDNPLLKMSKDEIVDFAVPHLKVINSKVDYLKSKVYLFHGPFAQPIFDKEFVKNKPDFITPVKNFYIANLDMTYPYDRGTNYAVKLGKDISGMI